MTTISYKDGVISGDGKMTLGDMVIKLDTVKVFNVNNHLVGVCGQARSIAMFIRWLQKHTDFLIINQEVGDLVDLIPPELENDEGYTALVVTPSRQVLMYEGGIPIDMGNDVPMSVGSGSPFALAAMKAGASAEEAVNVACSLDIFSGGTVTSIPFDEGEEELTREMILGMSKEEIADLLFPEDSVEIVNEETKVKKEDEDYIVATKTTDKYEADLYTDTCLFIVEVEGFIHEFDLEENNTLPSDQIEAMQHDVFNDFIKAFDIKTKSKTLAKTKLHEALQAVINELLEQLEDSVDVVKEGVNENTQTCVVKSTDTYEAGLSCESGLLVVNVEGVEHDFYVHTDNTVTISSVETALKSCDEAFVDLTKAFNIRTKSKTLAKTKLREALQAVVDELLELLEETNK